MEIDEIFHEIGESGKQQIKYGAVLFLLKVYTPFIILQYTFVARPTKFHCYRGEEVLENQCFESKVTACTNLTYAERTIVAEWDLVCDRNWMAKASMSMIMLGFLIGAVFLGALADKIGRKYSLMITLCGVITFNAISAITADYGVYIIARFLVGFFVSGKVLSIIVLVSELVGSRYRGHYGLAIMGATPIGIMLLTGLALIIQDWRSLTMTVSLIGCLFLSVNWYLVESPRWLLNVSRVKEALAVLEVIRKGNGTSSHNISLRKQSVNLLPRERIWNLLGRKKLTCMLYILSYIWFVNGATYYGLTLASGDIGTDLYTGMVLGGLAEFPALVLCYIFFLKLGRRLGLALFMFFSGLSCIFIHFVAGTSLEYLITSLALIGKMCIAGSFKVAHIISGEIFATSIRNSGLGFMSATARVGSILAPFIVMAGETSPGIHFTVFGILGLTGGLLSLFLQETQDRPLPETIPEMMAEMDRQI